jgi:hypothetical protein
MYLGGRIFLCADCYSELARDAEPVNLTPARPRQWAKGLGAARLVARGGYSQDAALALSSYIRPRDTSGQVHAVLIHRATLGSGRVGGKHPLSFWSSSS